MGQTKVELAVLNNVTWYEAVFTAHGLAFETNERVWMSHFQPPPFHSNLVVLSKATTQVQVEQFIEQIANAFRPGGWTIKDSYACLDLNSIGFYELFEASWIWLEPPEVASPGASSGIAWSRVSGATEMLEWEAAWAGDPKNLALPGFACDFPSSLFTLPGI